VTALTIAASAPKRAYLPGTASSMDRVIRISTAVVVLAVAGIAAYVSYWHAYAVVREYGETGVTARLEPVTIDGLVYASSMVVLYAARHQLPVPRLARWLLALGIVATLAANMAQGWSHGPGGMMVAAWPAVSLVGSYELVVWIIRKAAAEDPGDRVPAADQRDPQPDQAGAGPRPGIAQGPSTGPSSEHGHLAGLPDGPQRPDRTARADQPDGPGTDSADRPDHDADINATAVAAYRASLKNGRPLSERKLAGMFGKTSRRWARNRIAEARQSGPVPA
jgi:Protein of unknown function (DUF2637)